MLKWFKQWNRTSHEEISEYVSNKYANDYQHMIWEIEISKTVPNCPKF